jgi:hypothetical protein
MFGGLIPSLALKALCGQLAKPCVIPKGSDAAKSLDREALLPKPTEHDRTSARERTVCL